MNGNKNNASQSILLLAGAFTFAFLLGEAIHETGHYLCHLAYGNTGIGVHLDPFGGSRILGVAWLPDTVMGVTSAAGPLFNLALGLACSLLLWRRRQPVLLPLLLWGPVAMIQEGVTFSLGLLIPGGDAQWVAALGIPQPIILGGGMLLLLAGIGGITLLLPLAGIEEDDPWERKFAIVLAGMCSLMLLRCAHSFVMSPASALENLIPLVFSLLLAIVVVTLHKPLAETTNKASMRDPVSVRWIASGLAFALGTSIFFFQVVALN